MSRRAKISALPRLGLVGSVAMYGGGAALFYSTIQFVIPFVLANTHVEPIFAWFLAAGLGVFLPLIIAAAILLHTESGPQLATLRALMDKLSIQ